MIIKLSVMHQKANHFERIQYLKKIKDKSVIIYHPRRNMNYNTKSMFYNKEHKGALGTISDLDIIIPHLVCCELLPYLSSCMLSALKVVSCFPLHFSLPRCAEIKVILYPSIE